MSNFPIQSQDNMNNTATSNSWWRPKPYPSQSCNDSPNASYSMQEQPEDQPPLIPATIQAVTDSRAPSPGRTLVICLDGTGDKFDNDNSNVVQFVACLKKDDPSQLTYYQSGIGTYDGRGMTKGIAAAVDMAVGSGLGVHIRDAYAFLMQNYNEGDKICLLGFSRGSYTVRCLAGMLHKVGLLPAYNTAQINFAYKFYKDDTPSGWKLSGEFKKTFSQDVSVYFMGIWDCVASVGLIPRQLPFSKSPSNATRYFRHAMALDERRAKFKICRWQRDDPEVVHQFKLLEEERRRRKSENQKRLEAQFEIAENRTHGSSASDVKEVWFAGAHCDVGGGATPNGTRHQLSRIPLRWMIRQCFECNTGIMFYSGALVEVGLDVPTLWPVYKTPKKPIVGPSPSLIERYSANSTTHLARRSIKSKESIITDIYHETNNHSLAPELMPEQAEDHFDALAPINDQLAIAKSWWILEFWPIKMRVLRKRPERWEKVVAFNMGRWRPIKDREPSMHWTVQTRMKETGYRIRNSTDGETFWGVAV